MTPFSLEAISTIAEVQKIHDALGKHLLDNAGEALVIDASAVEDADVSLAQLLVSAGVSAAARDVSLSLRLSPVVSELLARAGLGAWAESVRA